MNTPPFTLVLADDEPPARARLARLLAEQTNVKLLAELPHGQALLDWLAQHSVDIVLLDIEMPGLNGLQTAEIISQQANPPAIIFCTAFEQHALAAFGVNAVDYLLKPVRAEALTRALAKAAAQRSAAQFSTEQQLAAQGRTHIAATTHKGLELIPTANILACLAEHKYVNVLHQQGDAVLETLIDEPLRDLEEEFPHLLIRAHRSVLVAKSAIERLEPVTEGKHQLILKGVSQPVPVSRRQLAEIKAAMRSL